MLMDSSKILIILWCLAGLLVALSILSIFHTCWIFYTLCDDWFILLLGFILLVIAFYGMTKKEGKT